MSSIAATNQQSVQWMHSLGVDEADIRWFNTHQGTTMLHSPESVKRVEKMYMKALKGIATSASPAATLANALLN